MKRLKQFIALAVCYCLLIQPVPVFAGNNTGTSANASINGSSTSGSNGSSASGVKIEFAKLLPDKDSFTKSAIWDAMLPYVNDPEKLEATPAETLYKKLVKAGNEEQLDSWEANYGVGVVIYTGDKDGTKYSAAPDIGYINVRQGKNSKLTSNRGAVIPYSGQTPLTKSDAEDAVKRVVKAIEGFATDKVGKDGKKFQLGSTMTWGAGVKNASDKKHNMTCKEFYSLDNSTILNALKSAGYTKENSQAILCKLVGSNDYGTAFSNYLACLTPKKHSTMDAYDGVKGNRITYGQAYQCQIMDIGFCMFMSLGDSEDMTFLKSNFANYVQAASHVYGKSDKSVDKLDPYTLVIEPCACMTNGGTEWITPTQLMVQSMSIGSEKDLIENDNYKKISKPNSGLWKNGIFEAISTIVKKVDKAKFIADQSGALRKIWQHGYAKQGVLSGNNLSWKAATANTGTNSYFKWLYYGSSASNDRYGYNAAVYTLPNVGDIIDELPETQPPGAKTVRLDVSVKPAEQDIDVTKYLTKAEKKYGEWVEWAINVKLTHAYTGKTFTQLLKSASKHGDNIKYKMRIDVISRSKTRVKTAKSEEDMYLSVDNQNTKHKERIMNWDGKYKFPNGEWVDIDTDLIHALEKGTTIEMWHTYFVNVTSISNPDKVEQVTEDDGSVVTTTTKSGNKLVDVTPVTDMTPRVIITLACSHVNEKDEEIDITGLTETQAKAKMYYRTATSAKASAVYDKDSDTVFRKLGTEYELWDNRYMEDGTAAPDTFGISHIKKWFSNDTGFAVSDNPFYLMDADDATCHFGDASTPLSETEKEVTPPADIPLPEWKSTLGTPHSELKEGDIYNEEFEAMAGTPTTRQLYFASGGKEYLAQIKSIIKVAKNTERSYERVFEDVQCSAHIDPSGQVTDNQDSPNWSHEPPVTKDDSRGYTVKVEWIPDKKEATRWNWSAPAVEKHATDWDENGKPTAYCGGAPAKTASDKHDADECGNPPTCSCGTSSSWSKTTETAWNWERHHNGHECNNTVSVSWKQPVENLYYVQITDCNVWQLNYSNITGMIDLTTADELKGTVISNKGKAIFNAAKTDTAKDGRMYYDTTGPGAASGTTRTGDNHVFKKECYLDTCIENPDHLKYQFDEGFEDELNNTYVQATCISDYLILETTKGDQSLCYFEYKMPEKVNIGKRKGDTEVDGESVKQVFTEEPSVGDMTQYHYINVDPDALTYGGYSGAYDNPTGKYESSSALGQNIELDSLTIRKDDCETKVDNTNVDSMYKLMVKFNPNLRAPNGLYCPEASNVFYETVVNYSTTELEPAYDIEPNETFGKTGFEFGSIYREGTSRVNDIVIHDPVSVQYAHIASLPEDRDQRTTKVAIEPEVHTTTTYVENCTYSGSKVHSDECYDLSVTHGALPVDVTCTNEQDFVGTTSYSGSGVVNFLKITLDHSPCTCWRATVPEGISLVITGVNNPEVVIYPGTSCTIQGDSKNEYYIGLIGSESNRDVINFQIHLPVNDYSTLESENSTPIVSAKYILTCDEPHHAVSSAYWLYTVGMLHSSGAVCSGKECPQCAAGEQLMFGDGTWKSPEQIKSSGILIKHDDNIHLSYGDDSYCHTCGRNVEVADSTPVTTDHKPFGVGDHYAYGDSTCYEERVITLGETNTEQRTTPGDFIQLDYEFQVYYPNIGDFYGNGALGIADCSGIEGKGFTTPMDTSEWTGIKGVTFDFDVIWNDKAYPAGTYIELYNRWTNTGYIHGKKGDDYYDFYVPLEQDELRIASCDFTTLAINNENDRWLSNLDVLNYTRDETTLAAEHDSLKTAYTQIIGRIGGLCIEDTGDWRYSNLFKQPLHPTQWLVNGTVKKVDSSKARYLVGDLVDIRGNEIANNGKVSIREHIMTALGLNTYGAEPYKNNTTFKIESLPLTPNKNNIKALRKQALRIGYKTFMDVETIGNYFGLNQGEGQFLQVTPVYYYFNSQTGELSPVDIYMKSNNEYVPINIYNNDRNDNVYPYRMVMNFQEEDTRRNVSNEEKKESQDLIAARTSDERTWVAASGTRTDLGTAQREYLDESTRTFIGSPFTNELNNNPDYVFAAKEAVDDNCSFYELHGQKWHFTLGLPSSAVWVKHGEECTEENIEKYRKKKSYLVCALDILAVGEVWTLRYRNTNLAQITINGGGNKPLDPKKVTVPDPDPSNPDIPIPIVEVYDTTHSSRDDIDTVGTH